MKLKMTALLLALCMMLLTAGCGASTPAETDKEPQDTVTEPVTEEQPLTALTATVTVSNSEELNTFIQSVTAMQPATYSNTRTVDGKRTTYTLTYEGSPMLEATLVTETADGQTTTPVTLFLTPYFNLFPDATGMNLDIEAYSAAIAELGLTPVFMEKSMQTLYGVYALGGVTMMGEPCVVDCWLNEQAVAEIEIMQMLQGGGMILQ